MNKSLEIILILFLSALSFFLGVKYSKSVKEHAGWMFETSGDEVELPDLSDTQNPEMGAGVDENGKPVDQATPPAEDQNIVPMVEEGAEAPQDNTTAPATAPAATPAKAPKK